MPTAIKILGVNGSMREGSHSERALRLAMQAAAEQGAETRFLDLRALDLPMFLPEHELLR